MRLLAGGFLPLLLMTVPAAQARTDGSCSAWTSAETLGRLSNAALTEVSGLAASHAWPGILWTHNDHGGSAVIYAVDLTGADRGAFSVLGATNEDWEDLALGPCGPTIDACACLYLADTGDNDGLREVFSLVRLAEPEPLSGSGTAQTAAEVTHFRYPDGSHDAEALVVHPETGETFLLTREADGRSGVFGFPEAPPAVHPEDQPATLTEVTWLDLLAWDVDSDQVTAAAASPRGERLAVRTNQDVLLFDVPAGEAFWPVFDTEPVALPAPAGAEGEAVDWAPSGDRLFFVGEGANPTLWAVDCVSFVPSGGDTADPLAACEEPPPCGCGVGPGAAGGPGIALVLLLLARRHRERRVW